MMRPSREEVRAMTWTLGFLLVALVCVVFLIVRGCAR
jgi:hypothetical protein